MMKKEFQAEFQGCIEDYRDGYCALCDKECNPHVRHIWGVQHKDKGDLCDMNIETCVRCAPRVSGRNWRQKKWGEQ